MNKVYVLSGFSASGKDSICKYISNKYNISTLISYTSRPIRPNEVDGIAYHFISKDQFKEMVANDEFIECREYHTLVNNVPDVWFYGMHKDSVDLSKHSYIVVLDILGLQEFKEQYSDKIVSFFINVDEPTRKQRCIDRADFDETEWNRRYQDDLVNFTPEIIKQEVDYIVDNYDFDKCVGEIVEKIGVV